MKKIHSTILLTMLLSMFCPKAFAHDIEVANSDGVTIYYNWTNNNTELSVSYRGNGYGSYSNEYTGNVVIPASVTYNENTYPVTSIGESAFSGCYSLTSIDIPNSVTSIGNSAFSGCSGLTSIDIPNSVTSIGEYAFSNCYGLTSVTIPNSVTSIGNSAFRNCSSLTSVTIPNSVTSIGNSAFRGCSSLTSITIGNSVTSIGEYAFAGCDELQYIMVPVTNYADFCNNQTVGVIGKSVRKPVKLIDEEGKEIKEYIIPNSVTSIGDYAFMECNGLTSITIGNSVTSIGYEAFRDCSGLTSVTIPNSVTSIGSNAFKCVSKRV